MTGSTTSSPPNHDDSAWFGDALKDFADEIGGLIGATVGPVGQLRLTINVADERGVIELEDLNGVKNGPPITMAQQPVARLLVRLHLRPDSSRRYIAVWFSTYALYSILDRTPIFRLDYREDMRSEPMAHWQVHAERGALSHLLTLGRHDRPHLLSALHFPVGGSRLRPCLEDFLQFLIVDCGFDALDGWRSAITEGRTLWRRRQIATVVRDVPDEAVRVLERLGYVIKEPEGGPAPIRAASLTDW